MGAIKAQADTAHTTPGQTDRAAGGTAMNWPVVPRFTRHLEEQRAINKAISRIMEDLAQGPDTIKIYRSLTRVHVIPHVHRHVEEFCPRCKKYVWAHFNDVCPDHQPMDSGRPYPWTQHTIDQHAREAVEGKDPWRHN